MNGSLTPTAVRELLDRQSVLLRLAVHELRRPLGVVDGYLSMLQDGSFGSPPEPEQTGMAVLAMAGAVQEMAALIDGLAAVARREDRADSLRRQRCSIGRLVAGAVAAVDVEAQARRVIVEHDGADAEVDVDPHHLHVAMVNLLGNAIQHSPAGSTATVTTRVHTHTVTIAVTDHGHGIDPSDAEHVFDPWYQAARASAGLGLGLWIVRQIVGWHGGRVSLESSPGRGSTFVVVLPSSPSSPPKTGIQQP